MLWIQQHQREIRTWATPKAQNDLDRLKNDLVHLKKDPVHLKNDRALRKNVRGHQRNNKFRDDELSGTRYDVLDLHL